MTSVDRKPNRHLNPSAYGQPLPTHAPLIGQAEMVRRIEAARIDTAQCPTCDGTIEAEKMRRCYACAETKPLPAFPRDRSKAHAYGYGYRCKACKRALSVAARQATKRRQWREALGRVS